MRFLATLFLLASIASWCQTWPNLKSAIKIESEKHNRAIKKARLPDPISFSDSMNHFLTRAVNQSGKPIYLTSLNANAAITIGVNKIQDGLQGYTLNGSGHSIYQWDAGKVLAHQEFDDRVLSNEGANPERHATHIAGTLMASGLNPEARGMASQANLHAYYFDDDIFEIAVQSEVNKNGYMISNHSYGTATGWHRINNAWQWLGDELVSRDEDFTAGYYSVRSKLIDEIAYLSPYHTIVWAAGNDRADVGDGSHPADCNGGSGYDCIIQEATAKNIITVGGVDQVLTYVGPGSVPMPGFSSWGPTDDGRIKPDLVSDGASVFSTGHTGVDQYVTLGGTSMAAATVSGSLLLLQELYGKLNGNKKLRAATLKALAIHTAKETGLFPGPDYSFGWGLIDVAAATQLISKHDGISTLIIERELRNDEVHEWILSPQPNQKITATMVWTDPAGMPPGAFLDAPYKMLVNDLDVKLIDKGGTTHQPWILNPDNPAVGATRGDNMRDNVEKIELDFPTANEHRLRISHKGYLVNNSQKYSIVITYTPINQPKTWYWIGGSGNWNDPSHWSTQSGGSSTGIIPGPSDLVIVDENSFMVNGSISLVQNESCGTLRWYCSKTAGLNFGDKTLTIQRELALASRNFQSGGTGKFMMSTTTNGTINALDDFLSRPTFDFTSGSWNLVGNLFAEAINITGGSITIENSSMVVNHFIGITSGTRFQVTNSKIEVQQSWQSDATKLNMENSDSEFIANGSNVSIAAMGLNWKGTLINKDRTLISGNIAVDSMVVLPGSQTSVANGNSVTISKGLYAQGVQGNVATINSSGFASLNVLFHKKICTDFVAISNISLTGDAVVSVGINGSLQNAPGWTKQPCAELLYPDFTWRYACEDGYTEFDNRSTGSGLRYQWDFGDGSPIATDKNPSHQFSSTGDYEVTITVTDGVTTRSFVQEVNIRSNTLPKTTIGYNEAVLFSMAEAPYYQWFMNGNPIDGATDRVFNYIDRNALYEVVLYDANCNSPSGSFVITGFSENFSPQVYPNPVQNRLSLNLPIGATLTWHNSFGQIVEVHVYEDKADVSNLPPGLYLVIVQNNNRTWPIKFIVSR